MYFVALYAWLKDKITESYHRKIFYWCRVYIVDPWGGRGCTDCLRAGHITVMPQWFPKQSTIFFLQKAWFNSIYMYIYVNMACLDLDVKMYLKNLVHIMHFDVNIYSEVNGLLVINNRSFISDKIHHVHILFMFFYNSIIYR